MTETRYKVVQWATGNIGSHSLRAVINHPNLDLVGLYVYSEDKAGRDAGDLAGTAPTGVRATRDIDEVLATLRLDWIDEHDAVVTFAHCATAFRDAGGVVAVVAHGRHIGDIDHRRLSALLLQNVDPPVTVPWHRR